MTQTGEELVVLLDADRRPCGVAAKATVHSQDTPLHLAFSTYLFKDGRLLLTQRAPTKPTWPGTWSNSCCGHPAPGEALPDAVHRRVRQELGLDVSDLRVALPDFAYRAVDASGVVENEVCPVYVGKVAVDPRPDPDEVVDWRWVAWDAVESTDLSPWAQLQLAELRGHDLRELLQVSRKPR